MQTTYIFGLVFGAIVLVSIFMRMRNQGMKERYATWWIVIALSVITFSVYPPSLDAIADFLGFQVSLNLLFFLASIVMLMLSLRFSIDLSRSDEERRRLTEAIAILRAQVAELQDKELQDKAS